jgi:hypothetical protein
VEFIEIPSLKTPPPLVDAFKKLSKESAMHSLKSYLKRTDEHKPDLPRLARYARELRVDIQPYIEALT